MLLPASVLLVGLPLQAAQWHVSTAGSDQAAGSLGAPLRTISAAAQRAMPGDEVIVQQGVYRERIDPPRGGESDAKRITYRAAEGAEVVIKGSEVVTGWKRLEHDSWVVELPNSFFGDFNPFADEIRGDWFNPKKRKHHTGAVYLKGHWLTEAATLEEVLQAQGDSALWHARVDDTTTTIWAQFKNADPNRNLVEVNARQSVFYPSHPGISYITVKGFTLEQAATPWAPPTAEQIGLIGTHWSKGWRIEDNTVRYSTCVGIALGKYGDEWDNRAGTAEGYNGTIRRALANGWSRQNIGSHLVSGHHISNCEQAGVVGSLGAVFSTIRNNHIHDIHVRQLFGGAEMAGIKIHASIDMLIEGNCIHDCQRGIWLDWMAQGVRVTRNLLFANGDGFDLFMEVNHGPYLVDHNVFLSDGFLWDWSSGGAYAHNVAVGEIRVRPQTRETPHHKAHSTEVAGLSQVPCGDTRWLNNLFGEKVNLKEYDKVEGMVFAGNQRMDAVPVVQPGADGFVLLWNQPAADAPAGEIVTSQLLGTTVISKLPFTQPDGSPYRLVADYFGVKRTEGQPGPFAHTPADGRAFKVWPLE